MKIYFILSELFFVHFSRSGIFCGNIQSDNFIFVFYGGCRRGRAFSLLISEFPAPVFVSSHLQRVSAVNNEKNDGADSDPIPTEFAESELG